MNVKWMVFCAALSPVLTWGLFYLFYMAAFGGFLPYMGSPSPLLTISWLIAIGVVSILGFYTSLLLTRRFQRAYWSVALLAVNSIILSLLVLFILVETIGGIVR